MAIGRMTPTDHTKRNAVLRMKASGLSFRKIGEELHISRQRAFQLYHKSINSSEPVVVVQKKGDSRQSPDTAGSRMGSRKAVIPPPTTAFLPMSTQS